MMTPRIVSTQGVNTPPNVPNLAEVCPVPLGPFIDQSTPFPASRAEARHDCQPT